jgi:hypothetical protein
LKLGTDAYAAAAVNIWITFKKKKF